MTVVAQEYIEIDDRGIAKILGTRSKVRMIAMDHHKGRTAEEIREAYPHLTLPQIYAALAYYFDHKEEIDANIEAGRRYVEMMRAKNPNQFTREELVARWKERFPGKPVPGDSIDED